MNEKYSTTDDMDGNSKFRSFNLNNNSSIFSWFWTFLSLLVNVFVIGLYPINKFSPDLTTKKK